MNDYKSWYNTDEGRAFFDKYFKGTFIEKDSNDFNPTDSKSLTTDLKNSFYKWANWSYETTDKATDLAKGAFAYSKLLLYAIIAIVAYLGIRELKKWH